MGREGAGIAEVRGDATEPVDRRRPPQDPDGAGSNPLAHLRPVGIGAVLDGGVELLRSHAGRLVLLTACLFVPVWLLNVALSVVAPPETTGSAGFDMTGMFLATSSGLVYVAMGLQLVALSVLGLCVGHLAMSRARGEDVSFGELGALALRRGWVALLIVPLNAVIQAPTGCLFGIGWVFGDALVFLSSVTAGAERVGPWKGFTRGLSLTTSDYGRALVTAFGSLCLTQLIRLSLSTGPSWLLTSLAPGSSLPALVAALSTAVLLLTQPLSACIAARAYLDLRCRREAFDLSLRHERMVHDWAEARR